MMMMAVWSKVEGKGGRERQIEFSRHYLCDSSVQQRHTLSTVCDFNLRVCGKRKENEGRTNQRQTDDAVDEVEGRPRSSGVFVAISLWCVIQ